MHSLPMNRWYITRTFFPAKLRDFFEAVSGLQEELEKATGDKYDLKIAFYRAAAPAKPGEEQPQPAILIEEISSLRTLRGRTWNQADYVEACFTAKPGDKKPVYEHATVTAKWPDERRITFHVEPEVPETRQFCQDFTANRFRMWPHGLDPKY